MRRKWRIELFSWNILFFHIKEKDQELQGEWCYMDSSSSRSQLLELFPDPLGGFNCSPFCNIITFLSSHSSYWERLKCLLFVSFPTAYWDSSTHLQPQCWCRTWAHSRYTINIPWKNEWVVKRTKVAVFSNMKFIIHWEPQRELMTPREKSAMSCYWFILLHLLTFLRTSALTLSSWSLEDNNITNINIEVISNNDKCCVLSIYYMLSTVLEALNIQSDNSHTASALMKLTSQCGRLSSLQMSKLELLFSTPTPSLLHLNVTWLYKVYKVKETVFSVVPVLRTKVKTNRNSHYCMASSAGIVRGRWDRRSVDLTFRPASPSG